MKTQQVRQGDLYIKQIDSLPKDIKKRNNTIILYGEATGHKHQLQKGQVFDGKNGEIFLNVPSKTLIVHEEHKPITLTKGKYAVIRQREYVMADMTRLVVD